jgi:putative DNA primase/helicase
MEGSNYEDELPDPTPLPNALPKVLPFEADLLPEALRGWVADIANRMQCPPDFPAVAALVALSSLIGVVFPQISRQIMMSKN